MPRDGGSTTPDILPAVLVAARAAVARAQRSGIQVDEDLLRKLGLPCPPKLRLLQGGDDA